MFAFPSKKQPSKQAGNTPNTEYLRSGASMSDASASPGRHKRVASWRSNSLISKFNQKIDSLKDKIPRGRGGSRQLDSEPSLPEDAVIPTGKRVASFAERSKNVLAGLDEGYFCKEFDPLTTELAQLPSAVGQEELDIVVDKLASALEVWSCYTTLICTPMAL